MSALSTPRWPTFVMAFVVVAATFLACAMPDAQADNEGAPAAPSAAAVTYKTGLYPLADNAEVPLDWMPPGSSVSPLPSEEIFPPQTLSLRFNHKKHVGDFKLTCKVCHAAAYESDVSSDRLLPKPTETCDNCHDVDHSDPSAVKSTGDAENGRCTFCHLGDAAGRNGKVAKVVIPPPNLRMTHKKHLARNIQCAQCHGQIDKIELATREQLPRMAGCFSCHAMSGAAQGEAKGQCINCHVTQPSGQMMTNFSTGDLLPPDWLHMAGHDADWIERHKTIAANDSKFCSNCHKEDDCAACHDGRVRNRKVHPNDWISMHPEAARMNNPRCTSCHQETTFCADCHRRVGVARDGPEGNRGPSEHFHPPRDVWTSAPRGPQHHAWEAEANINACVACHTERDCASCHAMRGIMGGAGVDPHPPGFEKSCGSAFARNPRPCLVCHERNDPHLGACE